MTAADRMDTTAMDRTDMTAVDRTDTTAMDRTNTTAADSMDTTDTANPGGQGEQGNFEDATEKSRHSHKKSLFLFLSYSFHFLMRNKHSEVRLLRIEIDSWTKSAFGTEIREKVK